MVTITSAPLSMSACAASLSLAGSNQLLIHKTSTSIFGLDCCAPSVMAFICRMISGIGWEPTMPIRPFLLMPPAMMAARYFA